MVDVQIFALDPAGHHTTNLLFHVANTLPLFLLHLLTIALLVMGLLSKPMLVSLPVVLLLVDYWPLRRATSFYFQGRSASIFGKSPIFPACRSFLLRHFSRAKTGWSRSIIDQSHAHEPISQCHCSYMRYLGKLLWPTDLAVLYPISHRFPAEVHLQPDNRQAQTNLDLVRKRLGIPFGVVMMRSFLTSPRREFATLAASARQVPPGLSKNANSVNNAFAL